MHKKITVLSGIQPSGLIHLGNYFGMIRQMLNYQNNCHAKIKDCELFAFIANYHALTSVHNREQLLKDTLIMAGDYLALGFNPTKSVFWLQSDVPEVTELTWILSQHISTARLELAHSFKEKIGHGQKPTTGLFIYPVLMAADILGFSADVIPVGKDQRQHLEICREIAKSFNYCYGDKILTVPRGDIIENLQSVVGTDGRKMSKSYKNVINPLVSEELLKKNIMRIQTDSMGVDQKKQGVLTTPLYQIYSLFADDISEIELKEKFLQAGSSYAKLKLELFDRILHHFSQEREQRKQIDTSDIISVLKMGAQKARERALPLIQSIRKRCGLYE